MSGAHGRIVIVPDKEHQVLLRYWDSLQKLYAGFSQAAKNIEAATKVPICVEGCGMCCENNTVHCYGVEAEYAASVLLGEPKKLKKALTLCREWLTRPGKTPYTYGRKMNPELWKDLIDKGELVQALTEDCPFLEDDKKCLIHFGRPSVCRAYGVTRLPGRDCKRPIGLFEDENSRMRWDEHDPNLPLYEMMHELMGSIKEPRYQRQGFLPLMIYERFKARDLAGLLDDGKVPLVKVVQGIGPGFMLLWQEEMEETWKAIGADRSISTQVPLIERDGLPVMQIGKPPKEYR